jgi:5'-3' exoribonuclease 1
LTKTQKDIFDKVKVFVLENTSASHNRGAKLSLPNMFPSRDRMFIANLSEDLHLDVTWDEYDEQDQNLVTWRCPRVLGDDDDGEQLVEDAGDEDTEWEDAEDAEDDAEARAAVDRVLRKYEKAPVTDPDAEGSFDERHEKSIKDKMDEWKRGYYRVRNFGIFPSLNGCQSILIDRKS